MTPTDANLHRHQIRLEIASITPGDAVEARHRTDALSWVDSGVELIRQSKPATPPQHLVSYFAVVSDDGHILLVDHKNAQRSAPRTQALRFDAGEFNAVRWFAFADVPCERSDPHMNRFIAKLQHQSME